MKNLLLTLFLVIVICQFGHSQITFEKTYGGSNDDWGMSGQPTSDGGYICVGTTKSFGAGNEDVYLIKLDQYGNSSWTKTYGGINKDQGRSVIQTSDGGYIICGYTNSFGAGLNDVYLVKTNSIGDTVWTKTFGGTDDEVGQHIVQLTDGSYVFTGDTKSYGPGSKAMFLTKASQTGANLWLKTYGGTNYELGLSCAPTTDGGFILVGMTDSYGAGNLDVFLLKTDINGDSVWSKTYGGSLDDFGNDVKQTTDGGYIVTSVTESFGGGSYDVYLIKTDSMGDTLWTKTFGGQGDDFGNCVIQTSDGGYAIIGSSSATVTSDWQVKLIKTDANGSLLWHKYFGGTGTDYSHSIQQTNDGGYFITGTRYHNFALDLYTIKTDATGNLTGVNEPIKQSKGLSIFPNPCNNNITINFEQHDLRLEIIDVEGRMIITKNIDIKVNQITMNLDLRSVPKGIYFVKIIGKKGARVGKLMKD